MLVNKTIALVLVGVCSVWAAGCPGDSARAQKPEVQGGSAASAAPSERGLALKPPTRALRRESPREAFLVVYRNPDEGITFRYPRNFTLEEGEVQEHSYFLRSQEELEREQPGSELIATVLIPEDGYPNTTFEHGSLQLVVHEAETAAGCRAKPPAESEFKSGRLKTAEGLLFEWIEQSSTAAGTTLRERSYAAVSGGWCYEFYAAVAAREAPAAESLDKPADTGKILHQLEKIVVSVQLRAAHHE